MAFTPSPVSYRILPMHITPHPSGASERHGVRRGEEKGEFRQSRGIIPEPLPRLPSLLTPRARASSAKEKHPPFHTRTHTHTGIHTHTHRDVHAHRRTRTSIHADFFVKAGKWDGVGRKIFKLPPSQLTLQSIEPLDTRTQPNAALTYLHTARKSSHC